jgi:hypothetical protein
MASAAIRPVALRQPARPPVVERRVVLPPVAKPTAAQTSLVTAVRPSADPAKVAQVRAALVVQPLVVLVQAAQAA